MTNRTIIRNYVLNVIEAPIFYNTILILIIANSIILGLESYPNMMKNYGMILIILDKSMLAIFVVELSLYFIAYGPKRCLKDPWYLFDAAIIILAIFATNSAYASLRAMRCLRILRLVTRFPNLRKVIGGLITAIPGIASIGTLLLILIYVGSVVASNLYGVQYPTEFGDLQKSALTLFQLMIADDAGNIIRNILVTNPYAWIFLILFLFVSAFIVLNLFVAVTVDAIQKDGELQKQERGEADTKALNDIKKQLRKLDKKIDQLSRITPT